MSASQASSGRRPANYYDILEVSRNASPEVIRAAYRSLMQRYHPDKNPGDAQAAEHAVRVAQAYETLSDAAKRAAYDADLSNATTAATAASVAASQAWMESQHAYQHARTVRKKNYASLILLLFVCAVVAAAGWALIATVRHVTAPASAPSASSTSQTSQASATPRRRLRILARSGTGLNAPVPSATPSGRDDAPSPPYDAPGAQGAASAETPGAHGAADNAAGGAMSRELPALVTNLSIALQNPQNPGEATGYRLEIPAVAVRLGGKQTASARDHLGNMTPNIRKALETRLELADYDSLMMPDGEIGLARLILAAIAQATGLPVCAGDGAQEAETCYGLVAVRLPEAYVVK